MASSFLPLGYQPQSEEEIKMTEAKEKLYEYYGIPYGVIDGSEKEDYDIEIEKDRTAAQILIMQGKPIPADLEKRLLEYKENEKNLGWPRGPGPPTGGELPRHFLWRSYAGIYDVGDSKRISRYFFIATEIDYFLLMSNDEILI